MNEMNRYQCFSTGIEGFTCGATYKGTMLECGDLEIVNQDKELVRISSQWFAET